MLIPCAVEYLLPYQTKTEAKTRFLLVCSLCNDHYVVWFIQHIQVVFPTNAFCYKGTSTLFSIAQIQTAKHDFDVVFFFSLQASSSGPGSANERTIASFERGRDQGAPSAVLHSYMITLSWNSGKLKLWSTATKFECTVSAWAAQKCAHLIVADEFLGMSHVERYLAAFHHRSAQRFWACCERAITIWIYGTWSVLLSRSAFAASDVQTSCTVVDAKNK